MIVNPNNKKDDWRTRKIVFYDTPAAAEADGFTVVGEQHPHGAVGTIQADPFHDWPDMTWIWPQELGYLINSIHSVCEAWGMPLPQKYIVSQETISVINALYSMPPCTIPNGETETICNLEGIPIVVGDAIDIMVGGTGMLGGWWAEFGYFPLFFV